MGATQSNALLRRATLDEHGPPLQGLTPPKHPYPTKRFSAQPGRCPLGLLPLRGLQHDRRAETLPSFAFTADGTRTLNLREPQRRGNSGCQSTVPGANSVDLAQPPWGLPPYSTDSRTSQVAPSEPKATLSGRHVQAQVPPTRRQSVTSHEIGRAHV